MDKENQDKNEFKVVDKRRFNSGGDETGVEDQIRNSTQTASAETKVQPAKVSKEEVTDENDKIDFVSFIVSLGTQALVMLGEIPNPETRQPSVNIDGAKQTIDILGIMAEKTKGNLTTEEDKLLTEILSSLRMTYVKKVGL